jgi:hypothetical protein
MPEIQQYEILPTYTAGGESIRQEILWLELKVAGRQTDATGWRRRIALGHEKHKAQLVRKEMQRQDSMNRVESNLFVA